MNSKNMILLFLQLLALLCELTVLFDDNKNKNGNLKFLLKKQF
jgi:hypothetical protein